MSLFRAVLSLALLAVVCLALPETAAAARPGAARQKKKQHKHPVVSGSVVKVHHNKAQKGSGTITVLVRPKKNKQNANAQAGQAGAARKGAAAVGRKKKPHTVKVHFNKQTKFAVVARGPVQGKAQRKTVGSGKNRATIVVPGKVKMKTQQAPAHASDVRKGQHVRVRIAQGKQNASHVHIVHASARKKAAAAN
jgi:hypothetical protein